MNEKLVNRILKEIENCAWSYDKNGRLIIIGRKKFRQIAEPIIRKLVSRRG